MKINFIQEPELKFGNGNAIDPKDGIRTFYPYDIDQVRPREIKTAFIGSTESVNKVITWFDGLQSKIEGKESEKKRLFQGFPGIDPNFAFCTEIVHDDSYQRIIQNSILQQAIKDNENLNDRIETVVEIYINEIKFLSKNKKVDVIICVLEENYISLLLEQGSEMNPKDLESKVEDQELNSNKESKKRDQYETNFRRLLKARSMKYGIPIQIVRDRIVKSKSDMQDQATIAWNLTTALYYKAGGIPWGMITNRNEITCYAGISFYKSRDRETLQTSIAQIFNELGKGVILRGEPVSTISEDRIPHLTKDQAYSLIDTSLKEYKEAIKTVPQRMVLHKSSNFSDDEVEGFLDAIKNKHGILSVDLVTIQKGSDLRLFRQNLYAPRRGTLLSISDTEHLLYTRGSVEYYETYTGKYPPSPLEIKIFHCDSSPLLICEEIVSLTKMNWNNSSFDRKNPITIECANKVGEILKYLDQDEKEQMKYSFYM